MNIVTIILVAKKVVMKTLVLVAILLSGCVKCQNGMLGAVRTFVPNTNYSQIGTVINEDFNGTTLSSNWQLLNGTTTTYSVSGGYLKIARTLQASDTLSGTGLPAATVKDFFKYTGYGKSTLRNYKMEMEFVLDSVNTASFGPQITAYSERNPGQNMTSGGYFNATTNSYIYHHYINLFGADGTGIINVLENASQTSIRIVKGDVFKYTFEVREGVAYYTVNNLSSAETVSTSYSYNYTNYTTNHVIPNIVTYGFAISGSSNISVNYFKVSSTDFVAPDYVFVGDSFTDGLYGGSPQNAFFKLLQAHTPNAVQEMAGGWDRSQDVIDNLAEIKTVNPKYVFLMIGINDLGNGVSLATLEANVTYIINQLSAAGITVIPEMIKTGGIPTTAGTYNKWLKDTYTNTLDTYTGLYGSGFVDASGHPNALGEIQIADRIRSLRPDLFNY